MGVGSFVEHKDKTSKSGYAHDKIYLIIDMNCRMKNPTTREWVDAVIYQDTLRNNYVREKNDFMDKFQKIEE